MSTTAIDHANDHSHDHAHDHPHGWRRWLYATNHKDIGTLYLWFSFAMLMSGGLLAMLIRAELFQPGLQLFQPEFFNQLTTMHGLMMVFGAIMPAFVGFANWMIPLQIGASDMAFARMNNFSFWLLPPAAILLATSFLVPGGATAAGWTLYAPLSTQMGPGMDMAIFAIHIMGASSIMGSINIITTILNMRAPRHDIDEDADVLLDLADYSVSVDCRDAGIGWGDHHDADGSSFRHVLFQCGWRR